MRRIYKTGSNQTIKMFICTKFKFGSLENCQPSLFPVKGGPKQSVQMELLYVQSLNLFL